MGEGQDSGSADSVEEQKVQRGSSNMFQLYIANLMTQLLPTDSRANLDTWL